MGNKKGKEYEKRDFSKLSLDELINRRIHLENDIERNFLALSYYINSTEGHLIEGVSEKIYDELSENYHRTFNYILKLNMFFPNNEIDLTKYEEGYAKLMDILEFRNREYLEQAKIDVLEGLSEKELRKKANL